MFQSRMDTKVLMLMLSYWGAASCVIAFESARQEGLVFESCAFGSTIQAWPAAVLEGDLPLQRGEDHG